GLGVFLRQTRHDKEPVAERVIKLHGVRKVVAEQRVEADVRAAAFKANVVEQLAQGLCTASVIAGELDGLIAHFRHRRDGAVQVLGALVANRIELKAERNFISAVFSCGKKVAWRRGRDGNSGGGPEEFPSGSGLGW